MHNDLGRYTNMGLNIASQRCADISRLTVRSRVGFELDMDGEIVKVSGSGQLNLVMRAE